jgi:uridine phosphorylase
MKKDELLPTLRVRPTDVSERVLVVGDQNRVPEAAKLLNNAKELGWFREYRTFTGEYAGKRITICSHGVGGPGANMCFHELFLCNVHYVIRAGTCGAMVPGVKDGDLLNGAAAIREDGCSEYMVPMSFPAAADRHVVNAIESAARRMGYPQIRTGLILSQAIFYPGVSPNSLDFWLKSRLVLGVEMEFATLLIMAGLKGVRAGGIFTSDGNLTENKNPDAYDPHREVVTQGKLNMLKIAIEALVSLPD